MTQAHRRTAAEAGRVIADALGAHGVPYALGGALALAAVGVATDRTAAKARAARDGMFVGTWDGMRIDVFVPSIPFSDEAARTRIEIEVDGWRGWFLSAEAIAIFKLLFFRAKDVGDLDQLIGV